MNQEQLDRAEALLGKKLPAAYRRFMETLPDDGQSMWFHSPSLEKPGPIQHPLELLLFNDAERLAVENLQKRNAGAIFLGERWPDRYLAIGDDGCGNTFCLDLGDEASPALLMFEHDPENGFVEVDRASSDVFARLKDYSSGAVREEAGDYLVVTRASAPWKSVLDPISLDEWSEYARTDPTITVLGFREFKNPFTKQIDQVEQPGHAVWDNSGTKVRVEYRHGGLLIIGHTSGKEQKMRQIARALNARLFGPGGAEIEVG